MNLFLFYIPTRVRCVHLLLKVSEKARHYSSLKWCRIIVMKWWLFLSSLDVKSKTVHIGRSHSRISAFLEQLTRLMHLFGWREGVAVTSVRLASLSHATAHSWQSDTLRQTNVCVLPYTSFPWAGSLYWLEFIFYSAETDWWRTSAGRQSRAANLLLLADYYGEIIASSSALLSFGPAGRLHMQVLISLILFIIIITCRNKQNRALY